MPDCAFQAQISPDQRQYLGNWAAASTADVYTRDKRNVVCQIWEQVCSRMANLQVDGRRMAREDINHRDYFPSPPDCPLESFTSPKKTTKEDTLSPDSWVMCDSNMTPSPPTGNLVPEKVDQSIQHHRVPADMVPEPKGPLTVACRIMGAKSKAKSMIHLFDVEGRGIGCGWMPSPQKCQAVMEEDLLAEFTSYGQCTKCFKFYDWPSTWSIPTPHPQSTQSSSDSSCGSLTDDSIDTDSDQDQVNLD